MYIVLKLSQTNTMSRNLLNVIIKIEIQYKIPI